jgi:hypothetical protein
MAYRRNINAYRAAKQKKYNNEVSEIRKKEKANKKANKKTARTMEKVLQYMQKYPKSNYDKVYAAHAAHASNSSESNSNNNNSKNNNNTRKAMAASMKNEFQNNLERVLAESARNSKPNSPHKSPISAQPSNNNNFNIFNEIARRNQPGAMALPAVHSSNNENSNENNNSKLYNDLEEINLEILEYQKILEHEERIRKTSNRNKTDLMIELIQRLEQRRNAIIEQIQRMNHHNGGNQILKNSFSFRTMKRNNLKRKTRRR